MRENVEHTHTIDTLIAELTRLREVEGGDTPVIVALENSSSEYSPLHREGVEVSMYWARCTWQGERFMTPENIAQEESGDFEEAPDDAIRAVFI